MEHHAGQIRWIDLGAGASAKEDGRDGLSIFKRGWAIDEKIKYFCGSICNRGNYRLLTGTDQIDSNYFPVYQAAELS